MDEKYLSNFLRLISQLQKDPNSLQIFHSWIKKNNLLFQNEISAGELLRLKNGPMQEVLRIAIKFRLSCQYCKLFPTQKYFLCRSDFNSVMTCLEMLASQSVLARIKPPLWYSSNGNYTGAEGFFECKVCGAIWQVTIPEKEDNGSINRIA